MSNKQTDDTAAPRVFTATVEAQYADELRSQRERSDADVRHDFIQPISDERLAKERAKETLTRRRWEEQAMEDALRRVLGEARRGVEVEFAQDDDPWAAPLALPTTDLDGVTITITVSDLVATATLAMP